MSRRLSDQERRVLSRVGEVFHQDFVQLYDVKASDVFDHAAGDLIGMLSRPDAIVVDRIAQSLLDTSTDAELRGHWKRTGAETQLNGAGVRLFLIAVRRKFAADGRNHSH